MMKRATPRDGTFTFPEADFELWLKVEGALRTRSHVPGGGEPLRAISRKNAWNNYCDALQALHRARLYDPAEPTEQRWTQPRIDALLSAKKRSGQPYAPMTIGAWLVGTAIVVRAILPSADVSALIAAERKLPRKGMRAKFLVDPVDLRNWSEDVMSKSLAVVRAWPDRRVSQVLPLPLLRSLESYRTALQVFILSAIALRLRNLTSTALGEHANLFDIADEWWLVFARNEMKGKRAYDRAFPPDAVPWLKSYLDQVRPLLARGIYDGNRLWLSRRGDPQSDQSIRKNIKRDTKEKFGNSITPHWFRDCVATSIGVSDPANLENASWILANQPDTVNVTYNHAGTVPARAAVVIRLASFAQWDTEAATNVDEKVK